MFVLYTVCTKHLKPFVYVIISGCVMVYIGHAEVQTRGTGGRGCGVHLQGGARAGGGQVPTLMTVPGSCHKMSVHVVSLDE